MGNEVATVLVAVLAVPGVQRLLEAVAVWIEVRARAGAREPTNKAVGHGEGGGRDDG